MNSETLKRRIARLFGRKAKGDKNHLSAAFVMFFQQRLLIKKANEKYFSNAKSEELDNDLKKIEQIDILLTANIGYLFNLITVALIPITALIWYFGSLPQEATRISVDVNVSELKWVIRNATSRDGEWEIVSSDTISTIVEYDNVQSQSANFQYAGSDTVEFIPKKNNPITLSTISLIDNSVIELRKPTPQFLSIIQNTRIDQAKPTQFTFGLECEDCKIRFDSLEYAAGSFYHVNLLKSIAPGIQFQISYPIDSTWRLPTRLFTDSISFIKSIEANLGRHESSVLSGTLRLLDVSDSTIQIYERDELRLVFKEPAELFIKSSVQGLSVHLEGNATTVRCGPVILGKQNDKMPVRARIWIKQQSHYLALLAIFLPLILSFFIRQRRSI